MQARGAMPEPDSREPWFISEAHARGDDVDRVVTIFEASLDAALEARAQHLPEAHISEVAFAGRPDRWYRRGSARFGRRRTGSHRRTRPRRRSTASGPVHVAQARFQNARIRRRRSLLPTQTVGQDEASGTGA
jgi:hypothetical protein